MGLNPSLFSCLANTGFLLMISLAKSRCPSKAAICSGVSEILVPKVTFSRTSGSSTSSSYKASRFPIWAASNYIGFIVVKTHLLRLQVTEELVEEVDDEPKPNCSNHPMDCLPTKTKPP